MYSSVKLITPQQAVEWLDTKNLNNRPISSYTVDRYAQEMTAGRWKLNGEPIIFAKSGRLIDGQHRLKASIQANHSFESLLVMGADDDVFDTVDDGKGRNLGDVLGIKGETQSKSMAAGLRFVWDYATGAFFGAESSRDLIASKQLLERLLDKHPGVRNSTRLYAMLNKRPGGVLLAPSLLIGLHYLFSLVNSEKADEFFTQFQSGTGLAEGSPILLLRNRMVSALRERGVKVLTRVTVYSYVVYAWNAFSEDRKIKAFSIKPEEAPPEISGLAPELAKSLLEW